MKYKETIDYPWVLARQLDRVLDKRTKINNSMMRFDYELAVSEYHAALTALWLALPESVRSKVEQPNGSLFRLDTTLTRIIDELDKRKLLIRKGVVPMGGEID